ncbi:DUF6544 family protein [Hydrogenimonas sp.]
MPPVLKKIIAVALLLIVANVGFVWYGQASYEATLKSLSKAFIDDNASAKTMNTSAQLPPAISGYIDFSNPARKPYRAVVLQFDGTYSPKEGKSMKMHALALLRPTPDMLWGIRLDSNPLITFNAIETYHASRAMMQTTLFGIIPIAKFDGTAFARSELAKILAYGLFNPDLLKCECIRYEKVDTDHTIATIEDGNLTASVTFTSDDKGRIVEVSSDDRVKPVNKKMSKAPWRMRVLSYKEFEGIRLPAKIEESWGTEEGRLRPCAEYTLTQAQWL